MVGCVCVWRGDGPCVQGTGLHLVGRVEKGSQEARVRLMDYSPKVWSQTDARVSQGAHLAGQGQGPAQCREGAGLMRRGRGQTLKASAGRTWKQKLSLQRLGVDSQDKTDPKGPKGPQLGS